MLSQFRDYIKRCFKSCRKWRRRKQINQLVCSLGSSFYKLSTGAPVITILRYIKTGDGYVEFKGIDYLLLNLVVKGKAIEDWLKVAKEQTSSDSNLVSEVLELNGCEVQVHVGWSVDKVSVLLDEVSYTELLRVDNIFDRGKTSTYASAFVFEYTFEANSWQLIVEFNEPGC